MLGFILYVAMLFGIPALFIVAILVSYHGSYKETYRQAMEAGDADPELQRKLKRKKTFLTIALVIGGVFVTSLVVMAVLLTTAVAFM